MISTETLYHSTLYHLNLCFQTQSMFVFHFLSQKTTVNFVTDPFWQNSHNFLCVIDNFWPARSSKTDAGVAAASHQGLTLSGSSMVRWGGQPQGQGERLVWGGRRDGYGCRNVGGGVSQRRWGHRNYGGWGNVGTDDGDWAQRRVVAGSRHRRVVNGCRWVVHWRWWWMVHLRWKMFDRWRVMDEMCWGDVRPH